MTKEQQQQELAAVLIELKALAVPCEARELARASSIINGINQVIKALTIEIHRDRAQKEHKDKKKIEALGLEVAE